MKTFEDFILEENKKKENLLSWKSSFAEMRRDSKKNKKITEQQLVESNILQHTGKSVKNYRGMRTDEIHYHDDIRPKNVTPEHIESMRNFTLTKGESDDIIEPNHAHSSRVMNTLLRHEAEHKPGEPNLERS